ncbi:MAG: LPS assembly protein LptD, partial [Acidobacteriota bacterium]
MKRYLLLLLVIALFSAAASSQAQSAPQGSVSQSTDAQGDDSQSADAESPAAEPEDDRVRFEFTLSNEAGGKGTLEAGDIEYQENLYLIATGGVDFKYRGVRLQAERVRVDIPTNLLTAEGEVILDEGPQRLIGETIEYDLGTRTGRVTQATAFVENEYYFTGSQITKTGDVTFSVDDGIFTSCNQDVPSWSLHMSDAKVTLDEFVRVKNARLKLKKLPILYSPYLVWPANTERSSGFLVPKPGFSSRRGAELSSAYYKTLGRSADTTFQFDVSSDGFLAFGNEYRYRPSEGTQGYFKAYVLSEPDDADMSFFTNRFDDAEIGDTRWKVEFVHDSRDLFAGFRGAINFRDYSDLDYLQDYERNANQQSQAFIYSNAYLSKNFGPHSFNVMIDQRERIQNIRSKDVRRQLPEIEYRLRKLRLGQSQIYLDLESALHYFQVDISNTVSVVDPETGEPEDTRVGEPQEYGRFDLS